MTLARPVRRNRRTGTHSTAATATNTWRPFAVGCRIVTQMTLRSDGRCSSYSTDYAERSSRAHVEAGRRSACSDDGDSLASCRSCSRRCAVASTAACIQSRSIAARVEPSTLSRASLRLAPIRRAASVDGGSNGSQTNVNVERSSSIRRFRCHHLHLQQRVSQRVVFCSRMLTVAARRISWQLDASVRFASTPSLQPEHSDGEQLRLPAAGVGDTPRIGAEGGTAGLRRPTGILLLRPSHLGTRRVVALQARQRAALAVSGPPECPDSRTDVPADGRRCRLQQGAGHQRPWQSRRPQPASGAAVRCADGDQGTVPRLLLAGAHLLDGREARRWPDVRPRQRAEARSGSDARSRPDADR